MDLNNTIAQNFCPYNEALSHFSTGGCLLNQCIYFFFISIISSSGNPVPTATISSLTPSFRKLIASSSLLFLKPIFIPFSSADFILVSWSLISACLASYNILAFNRKNHDHYLLIYTEY